MPSAKALEAAAMIRLAELNKGQKVQPSEKVIQMAAKAMASRAMREAKS